MQIRARMSMSADGYVRTIETFRALGVLDKLELVILPLLFGGGMRLTDGLRPEAGLTFERERALPGGSIVYTVAKDPEALPGRAVGWSPASQRPR